MDHSLSQEDSAPRGPAAGVATLSTWPFAEVIENALLLATTPRLTRPADAPPLGMIRSLAYLPVIEEVLKLRVSPDYCDYLRHKLAHIELPACTAPLA